MILEQALLQKLSELRHNNNKLIIEMKEIDKETLQQEQTLNQLKKDLIELQECFSIISKPLSEISSQIAYLKEQSKSKGKKKSTSKKSNTKKKNQKLKIDKIENLTEKEKSLKYSELIIFLFNEYVKTKSQDEIIDEFIEDDDQVE